MSDGLNKTADLLDEASQSLDDIEPPEDVADAHQAMVDKSAAAADKIREFADTVANASLAELQDDARRSSRTSRSSRTFRTAVNDIKAKGYDIGGNELVAALRARAVRAWRRRGASAGRTLT